MSYMSREIYTRQCYWAVCTNFGCHGHIAVRQTPQSVCESSVFFLVAILSPVHINGYVYISPNNQFRSVSLCQPVQLEIFEPATLPRVWNSSHCATKHLQSLLPLHVWDELPCHTTSAPSSVRVFCSRPKTQSSQPLFSVLFGCIKSFLIFYISYNYALVSIQFIRRHIF